MAFLRNLFATLLGLFIFFVLVILIVSGIAASADKEPEIADNSILHLKLSGAVVERAIDDPLEELISDGPKPIDLLSLIQAIKAAGNDDRIAGIYLEPQFLQAGYSSLQEIRDALISFKTSGKFLYAFGEYLSEGDYYLVSVADSIYLHPEGALEFNGLTAGVTFFKGLLDKLDIEPEIFRVGQYKSFVEPFTRKSMSDENKEQLTELIQSVHSTYLEHVSISRGMSVSDLKRISDGMEVRFPEDAVEKGLVEAVAYEDEIIDVMKLRMGKETSEKVPVTEFRKYMKVARNRPYSSDKVAVIVATGNIVMGQDDESIGGEQFANEIRKARENKSVKAIVLRVNSPGGSLTASDMIWREIMLTKGKKPIIASMSDVAASGGYYISMPCDTIVAQPNTITGSIGIFGMLFNLGGFLESKLGITTDRVNTGEFSDIPSLTRSLTDQERAIIQAQVEDGYKTFTTKAAEGRGMALEQLREYAGGRVWSGAQAHERGLVDVLGSFDDAVVMAATKAGLGDEYSVRFYPEKKPFIEQLLSDLGKAKVRVFNQYSIIQEYKEKIETLNQMQGVQALLPGSLTIQ